MNNNRLSDRGMSLTGKRVRLTRCLAIIVLLSGSPAVVADSGDRDTILAVMERAFAAVRSQDPDDWRAIQLAEGNTLSFRPKPDGSPGALEMRQSSNEQFVASLEPGEQDYLERWTGEPTVLIRGPIAVVWGEYEFLVDGEFSHCGVNAIDLVRVGGEWKIANLTWTVEKEGCPTGPAS